MDRRFDPERDPRPASAPRRRARSASPRFSGQNQSVVFQAGRVRTVPGDGRHSGRRRGSPGYAVELWFLSEAISHAALASLSEPTDTHPCQASVHHRADGADAADVAPAGRGTVPAPLAAGFGGRASTSTRRAHYVPYRWHHLVAQVEAERMELYLDGTLTESMPVDPDRASKPGHLAPGPAEQGADRPLVVEPPLRRPDGRGRPLRPSALGRGGPASLSPGAARGPGRDEPSVGAGQRLSACQVFDLISSRRAE